MHAPHVGHGGGRRPLNLSHSPSASLSPSALPSPASTRLTFTPSTPTLARAGRGARPLSKVRQRSTHRPLRRSHHRHSTATRARLRRHSDARHRRGGGHGRGRRQRARALLVRLVLVPPRLSRRPDHAGAQRLSGGRRAARKPVIHGAHPRCRPRQCPAGPSRRQSPRRANSPPRPRQPCRPRSRHAAHRGPARPQDEHPLSSTRFRAPGMSARCSPSTIGRGARRASGSSSPRSAPPL